MSSARVTAHWPGGSFCGRLTHAAADLATIRDEAGTVLHLRLGSRVLLAAGAAPGPAPLEPSGPDSGSFIARLRQLELDERPVRVVVGAGLPEITGVLRTVAADHVVVDIAARTWVIPHDAIVAVATAGD